MPKDEEEYSTEQAWKNSGTNAQADIFRSLADGLRRENFLIKKMLYEKDKKITEQEMYIEQLENKVESLRESIRVLGTAYKKRIVPTIK
tara:strand:- start:216 stop:482 length:267 start_codon:yes stop_codon:yes gene_type:complete